MRVLITGGAGFIGSHVVDRAVERGHEVVVLDNLDPQVHGAAAAAPVNILRHIESRRIEFIRGDVRDRPSVSRALHGVDTVVHLAAAVGVGQSMYQPHYYADVNAGGQGMLMEEMARDMKRYRRLVVASSMSIYGEGAYECTEHGRTAPPPRDAKRLAAGRWEVPCPRCGADMQPVATTEDKLPQPTSVYAISKKAQEELALCFGTAYGLPVAALRFFNVFGSRQALSNPYTGVAAIFLSRLKNGRPPIIFEDGGQSRDFVHVHDVARAVVRCIELDGHASGAYNVCSGKPVTIGQVAKVLAGLLRVELEPEAAGRYRAGDIRHCFGNPARAADALDFTATCSFEDGMRELIRWAAETDAEDRVEASLDELQRQGLVRQPVR